MFRVTRGRFESAGHLKHGCFPSGFADDLEADRKTAFVESARNADSR
jgi:hypothetical protein